MRSLRTWVGLVLASMALVPVEAHVLARSESRLVVHGREISAHLTFNLLDFQGVDRNGDQVVTPEEFAPAFERVYAAIPPNIPLRIAGPPCGFTPSNEC